MEYRPRDLSEQQESDDVDYLYLRPLCADQEKWQDLHPALATATPEERERVCRVLLDHLRRELAIRVDDLDPNEQESLRLEAHQHLVAPWTLEGEDRLERSRIVLPRSRGAEGRGRRRRATAERLSYLSSRGGFGLYLMRPPPSFAGCGQKLRRTDVDQILRELLEVLRLPGLVARVVDRDDDPGYQLNAAAMVWRAGDGTAAFHDPVRVPNAPVEGLQPNPFFKDFYRGRSDEIADLRTREHTAQVPREERIEREQAFREARLRLLFCSPTMELGVDIQELNAVGLRNVPPTPANYAQRSGRAGRGGQPAFVFTYCSAGSPHDQYFFQRPERMVAGAVTTPRLDLTNEDLLRAHVHAIFLRAARLDLGTSLADVLEVGGEAPSLAVRDGVRDKLLHEPFRVRTREQALAAMGEEIANLSEQDGDPGAWLDAVLRELPRRFEDACDRWRTLYRAAFHQAREQGKKATDASRDPRDRDNAKRLRGEAERQLELLLYRSRDGDLHGDFYSYRYFAGEGFLPGYSFPRLPLSAYLPGRRTRLAEDDDFLSRPRFLAIAEFGPHSIIYHEGSKYQVNRALLPVRDEGRPITHRAVQCAACGYLHVLTAEAASDLCEKCGEELPAPYTNLFKMENASTRRRERISSDEEERRRQGYELKIGVRFSERSGRSSRSAVLRSAGGEELATFEYGAAATVWRLNLGNRRREVKERLGYQLDVERGYWARSERTPEDDEDPLSPRIERVIPFVEDQRNCLLVRPATADLDTMASLMAALKAAIQVTFQLEDRELEAEPLPDESDRRLILFYEAAEGGAGILRRLIEPGAAEAVARQALEICHFDPATGADLRHAPGRGEDCEAACYDCLLSYYNQRDHRHLDRHKLSELLLAWTRGSVDASPTDQPRDSHLARLLRLADSELERKWLRLVQKLGLRLPDDAQVLIEECRVRPDYFYREHNVAVFIDGPPHDDPDQKTRDEEQQDLLEDQGYTVLRFHHGADWEAVLRRHPGIFGAFGQR